MPALGFSCGQAGYGSLYRRVTITHTDTLGPYDHCRQRGRDEPALKYCNEMDGGARLAARWSAWKFTTNGPKPFRRRC